MHLSEPKVRSTIRFMSIVVACTTIVSPVHAQISVPAPARNTIFIELGGAGLLYSLNLERLLNARSMIRIGATAWSTTNIDRVHDQIRAIPVAASTLIDATPVVGGTDRFFEIGAGFVAGRRLHGSVIDGVVQDSWRTIAALTANAGIRYQPREGGWMYRAGFSPFLSVSTGRGSYPNPGFTMGYEVSGGRAF